MPYNAFDGAMDGMADYLARCKEGLVERLLPMDIADLCRMFPVFGEVGPCQRLLQGSKSGGTEQESRQRAVAALREMLGRMVRFGSALVVLFLDDVQRCDQDSAELFEGLMRLPQAPPVLVLAAFRRDDVAASRFLPGLLKVDQPAEQRRAFAEQAEIALEGLSAEEVAELAASHGQAARAGEITRESGGVPIFIDYLLEPGAAAPSAPSASEPFSLAVVLGQRIERLPPDQQRLLQIVAIGGRPVAESLALRAAGLGGSAVAAAPDLRRQRFLRTLAENEEPLIETYHDRLRDAVLRSLSAEEVRAGSAALAEALESGRGRDAEWLAELWARAGQKEKAGEYSYLAAERAQRAWPLPTRPGFTSARTRVGHPQRIQGSRAAGPPGRRPGACRPQPGSRGGISPRRHPLRSQPGRRPALPRGAALSDKRASQRGSGRADGCFA